MPFILLKANIKRLAFLTQTLLSLGVFSANSAKAQITPDSTLPTNSQVTTDVSGKVIIEGGTQSGTNLFHSFDQFSVNTGSSAYFNNPSDITNIITRVTGRSVSNIDGTIGANGTANLFLINPNGIIFGRNAKLDIGGSFVASTANSLKFDDGSSFSATEAETTPLLTVSAPSGLQFGQKPENINILSRRENFNDSIEFLGKDGTLAKVNGIRLDLSRDNNQLQFLPEPQGLSVNPGKSIAFIGGDVNLDGAIVQASGGKVELGGIAEAGNVGLNTSNGNLSLSFPESVARGKVSFSNFAEVNVASNGGGDIVVNASNIDITGQSSLIAGTRIARTSNIPSANTNPNAGDIKLNATGDVNFVNSFIFNSSLSQRGNGGNIQIQGRNVNLTQGLISIGTISQNPAGNLEIFARESVNINNISGQSRFAIFPTPIPTDISLTLTEIVNFVGLENLQKLNIPGLAPETINSLLSNRDISDRVIVRLTSVSLPSSSSILSFSFDGQNFLHSNNITNNNQDAINLLQSFIPPSGGDAGNVSVTSKNLLIQGGSVIGKGTIGEGRAGDLNFNIESEMKVDSSAVYNILFGPGRGLNKNSTANRGNITVNAGNLIVKDGFIGTATLSQTTTGDLTVKAKDLVEISASDRSNGTSEFNFPFIGYLPYPIGLFSGSVAVDDIPATPELKTALERLVVDDELPGTGNAGTLSIEARRLIVRDGAVVSAGSATKGQAGNLIVKTTDLVELSGYSKGGGAGPFAVLNEIRAGEEELAQFNFVPSGLLNYTSGYGPGGNLTVDTKQLIVKDGASISGGTTGSGTQRGGDVTVNATESIHVIGTSQLGVPSLISTGTRGSTTSQGGNSGDLTISTKYLEASRGGIISAASISGDGQGGKVTITASDSILLTGIANQRLSENSLKLFATEPINALPSNSPTNLLLRTFGDLIAPSGIVSGSFGNGSAGELTINTGRLSIEDGAQVSAFTLGRGNAGNLNINADEIRLSGDASSKLGTPLRGSGSGLLYGRSLITTAVGKDATGRGGDININTNSLNISKGARLTAETAGRGNAGNVDINTKDSITLSGKESGLFAQSTGQGSAGTLKIKTENLNVKNLAEATVSSENGQAGNLKIKADFINLNTGNLTAITGTGQNGGSIELEGLDLLLMRNGSQISAQARNQANGGNVAINAKDGFIVALPGENSDIRANAQEGDGGKINIKAFDLYGFEIRDRQLLSDRKSEINASSESGVDGSIRVNTPGIDPENALINLPSVPVDTEIAQGCYGNNQDRSRFVNAGRGGLPPSPSESLNSDLVQVDWVKLKPTTENRDLSASVSEKTNNSKEEIVEATGWMVNQKGKLIITADSLSVGSRSSNQPTSVVSSRSVGCKL